LSEVRVDEHQGICGPTRIYGIASSRPDQLVLAYVGERHSCLLVGHDIRPRRNHEVSQVIVWITDKGRVEQKDIDVGPGTTIVVYAGPEATIKGAESGTRRWEMAHVRKVQSGDTIVLSNAYGA
jgi:hypothetical protein